jgi:hypothetical protein
LRRWLFQIRQALLMRFGDAHQRPDVFSVQLKLFGVLLKLFAVRRDLARHLHYRGVQRFGRLHQEFDPFV